MSDVERRSDEPVELRNEDGSLHATFLPSVGMVCSSLRHDGEQLLALRDGVAAYRDHGSTFGIPLLHPWANRLAQWGYETGGRRVRLDPARTPVHRDGASGLPIHGLLAANPDWSCSSTSDELLAEFDFGAHPELLAGFPFPHRLELVASLAADRLSVRITLTPTGPDPVPISFGFHPWLTLPGSDRDGWLIGLPVRRRMLLDPLGIPTGASEALAPGQLSGPLGERTFDDCFDELDPPTAGPIRFTVADERRLISLEFVEGYDVAQVYAPTGSDVICFEPMTAPVNALCTGERLRSAQPGSHFAAEFAITVSAVK